MTLSIKHKHMTLNDLNKKMNMADETAIFRCVCCMYWENENPKSTENRPLD